MMKQFSSVGKNGGLNGGKLNKMMESGNFKDLDLGELGLGKKMASQFNRMMSNGGSKQFQQLAKSFGLGL
jgi:hypothetical protein